MTDFPEFSHFVFNFKAVRIACKDATDVDMPELDSSMQWSTTVLQWKFSFRDCHVCMEKAIFRPQRCLISASSASSSGQPFAVCSAGYTVCMSQDLQRVHIQTVKQCVYNVYNVAKATGTDLVGQRTDLESLWQHFNKFVVSLQIAIWAHEMLSQSFCIAFHDRRSCMVLWGNWLLELRGIRYVRFLQLVLVESAWLISTKIDATIFQAWSNTASSGCDALLCYYNIIT